MKRLFPLAAVTILGTSLATAADPALLGLVAPETKIVTGIQIDQSKASPFGQFLLSQMQLEDNHFRQFVQSTGFDPRRDLREILIASDGTPNHRPSLIAVRGQFDLVKILALARNEGATASKYLGYDVVTPARQGAPVAAFIDSSLAVLGDAAAVRASLDRRQKGGAADAALVSKINEASGQYDAWFVSLVPVSQLATQVMPPVGAAGQGSVPANLLQAIQQATGGVRFGSIVQVGGEALTRSPQDATALTDVVRFLANLAQGQLQQGQTDPALKQFAALLNGIELRTDGAKMKWSVAVPEAELEQLIQSSQKPRRATRTRRAA